MTPVTPLRPPERPLSATRLAQYATVRGRCERYLRLALFPSEGQALMHRYGVRPEALSLGTGSATELSLPVEIDVVELTGPEQVTTARVGPQRLTATLPPQARVAKGQSCAFAFDEDALRLFDPATGKAL